MREKKIGNITFRKEVPITTKSTITWQENFEDNFLNNRIQEKINKGQATCEDIHDLKLNGNRIFKSVKKMRKIAKISMYADDNGARNKHKGKKELEKNTPKALEKLFEEMRANRLQVNEDKTSLLVICNTKKRNTELKNEVTNNFKINVEGHDVIEDLTAKLLGVQFDRTFTFEQHMVSQRQAIM